MMSSIFSSDDLNRLPRKSLERLASYYKLEYNGLDKDELVDKLLQIQVEPDFDGVQMSVRVRRIKESSKNG